MLMPLGSAFPKQSSMKLLAAQLGDQQRDRIPATRPWITNFSIYFYNTAREIFENSSSSRRGSFFDRQFGWNEVTCAAGDLDYLRKSPAAQSVSRVSILRSERLYPERRVERQEVAKTW